MKYCLPCRQKMQMQIVKDDLNSNLYSDFFLIEKKTKQAELDQLYFKYTRLLTIKETLKVNFKEEEELFLVRLHEFYRQNLC